MKKIFCLPYAGGSAPSIYSKWKRIANNGMEIVPIELAGRGALFGQKNYTTIEEAINSVFDVIKNNIGKTEYKIWGHSMGAIIAFEVAKLIHSENMANPVNIILSGMKPLHLFKKEPIHELPDDQFIEKILEMNGTPEEVFENDELKNMVLPILRSDFKLVHQYKYQKPSKNFDISIMAVTGDEEDITDFEKVQWNKVTSGKWKALTLKGDHFFINNNVENMFSILKINL